MQIRRFQDADAEPIAKLVRRNLLEVNTKDYTCYEMVELANGYTAEKIRDIAACAHMYVACDGCDIVGTGTISSLWGSETESVLLTIFVLPEFHKKGIGKAIIEALEQDDYFLRASRIEIPSSITACTFYEKMGYRYKGGIKELDDEGLYRMEKYR